MRPIWSARAKGPSALIWTSPASSRWPRKRAWISSIPATDFLSENAEFARACAEAGITFVGPRPELLELMGDKTAARALAQKVGVPDAARHGRSRRRPRRGAEDRAAKSVFRSSSRRRSAAADAACAWCTSPPTWRHLLDEAQGEAGRAFGNPAVFLEKYIPRAKHIEVQILGDRHGNVVHLHERDCSVQRRHQKVIEIAPVLRPGRSACARNCARPPSRLAREVKYDNAGTVEFLYDLDKHEWFFIEMNPRIQVEHTVTEVITGLDLVRSQILIAQGQAAARPGGRHAARRRKFRATATPCNAASPPRTRKTNSRPITAAFSPIARPAASACGWTAAWATRGAVITPFYDSLLVKITAFGADFRAGACSAWTARCANSASAASRRIFRSWKTSSPIPIFRSGQATTTLIDTTPELFQFKPRRDRATKLLAFLGDVIVNGNPQAKGYQPKDALRRRRTRRAYDRKQDAAAGHAAIAAGTGPEKIRRMDAAARSSCSITDTTFRDAHQSLLATRVRSYDMLAVAPAVARRTPQLFSLEMWGGATFDTAMRFLHEDPWDRLRLLREKIPNICFQMLFRGVQRRRLFQLSRQRRGRICQTCGGVGHRYFPHFRFAQLHAELEGGHGGGPGDARRLRGGDLLHRRHP